MILDQAPTWRLPRPAYPQLTRVDLRGRVIVVSGASSGIGLHTALRCAEWGAEVALIGRHPQRLQQAWEAITRRTGNHQLRTFRTDFSSLALVRQLAQELLAQYPRIHVLINNAGLWSPRRALSADGLEMTFAVNYLAPFLLTQELQQRLIESSPARVVHVSSRWHERASPMRFEDLQLERRRYRSLVAYRQSKLANVLFSNELAARLRGTGVTSNALHPGDVATAVVRDSALLSWAINPIGKRWLLSPEEGARNSVHLATHPELETVTGRYFSKLQQTMPNPEALNEASAAQLWRLSESLCHSSLAPA